VSARGRNVVRNITESEGDDKKIKTGGRLRRKKNHRVFLSPPWESAVVSLSNGIEVRGSFDIPR
jgi:hypothetical protein